jgi:uncharacterized protein YggE
MTRTAWAFFALAALLALVLALFAVPRGATGGGLLTVNATGTATLVPDEAVITLGLVNTAATADGARAANDALFAKVLRAVLAQGVARRDVSTSGYNLTPVYGSRPNVITGYQASDQVTVTARGAAQAGRVIAAATAAGANTVNGLTWQPSDATGATTAAYLDALAQARRTATALAKRMGVHILGIRALHPVAVTSPIPYASLPSFAERAAAPISPGTLTVSVTLAVEFAYR